MTAFKCIMIVEDDDDIRETMRLVVESEGFHALLARNGREAIDLLRDKTTEDPCLILLDLMMPEMNGWEFLEMRREADVIAAIPTIVVSAVSPGKYPKGATKILRKPVDLDKLIHDFKSYCGEEIGEKLIDESQEETPARKEKAS